MAFPRLPAFVTEGFKHSLPSCAFFFFFKWRSSLGRDQSTVAQRACLGVICHLHSWQNERGLLRANAVTRGRTA